MPLSLPRTLTDGTKILAICRITYMIKLQRRVSVTFARSVNNNGLVLALFLFDLPRSTLSLLSPARHLLDMLSEWPNHLILHPDVLAKIIIIFEDDRVDLIHGMAAKTRDILQHVVWQHVIELV